MTNRKKEEELGELNNPGDPSTLPTGAATETTLSTVSTNVAKTTAAAVSATPVQPTHTNMGSEGTATYLSSTTITMAGFPFTVADANCQVLFVSYRPSGGTWQPALVNGVNGVSITSAANVVSVAGAGTPFATGDTYFVGLYEQDSGNDEHYAAGNAKRTYDISPPSSQHDESTLFDLTNIPADTTDAEYIDMDGRRSVGIQFITSGTAPTDVLTITLEVTLQDDETAPESIPAANWINIVPELTGGSTEWTDTDEEGNLSWLAVIDVPLPVKYVKVGYSTSDTAGDDCDLTVFVKKLY